MEIPIEHRVRYGASAAYRNHILLPREDLIFVLMNVAALGTLWLSPEFVSLSAPLPGGEQNGENIF
jgi:hypothetical protein